MAPERNFINDSRLSFRARGVLAWMLDQSSDSSFDSATMAENATEGRDAIRTAVNELIAARYLTRTKWQDPQGRWVTRTTVTDGASWQR